MSSNAINRSARTRFFLGKVNLPALAGLCLIGGVALLFYGSLILIIEQICQKGGGA